jgi:hypothetical protein
MTPPANAPTSTGPTTHQRFAWASPTAHGTIPTGGALQWIGPVNMRGKPHRHGPHVTLRKAGSPASAPPTGGSRGGTPQTSGSPREGDTPQKSGSPQEGASSPSSAGTSLILLTDPTQVLGPSLHSTVVGDFADAHLVDNPTATRIQVALEVHAATFNREFTNDLSLAAIFLKKFNKINNKFDKFKYKFDEINNRLDGMQMTITAVRDEFTPCLAILDKRITTTNERIKATASSTATMLHSEFAQKLSKLSERIGTTDDTLKATMDTKAAPGLSELEARVRILESRPSVDPAPNPLLPHENPTGDVVPPARPHDNHLAARPRVDTTFSPGNCVKPNGLSVEERARSAWAGSPSGRNAGAQVPDPHPQPPSETSQNPPQSATPPRNHPLASHDTALTPGDPIVSPRQGDREGQARQLGASRFDIVRLATPDYHIGTHGVAVLTHAILVKCGYNQIVSSDVVTCHNNIIAVHRRVRELWYNPSTHTYGPQVKRIVTKSLKLLLTLDSATTEMMVDFYDRLQESATGLAIAIMPFDTVMIKNGLEGLCIPGLGVDKYHVMSKALMELLPRLISCNLSPQINAALASVRSESGNGYNFLWRVLELTVPGFDPVIPIQVPQWSNTDDIFSFAQAYPLHSRLQGKMNFHYSNCTCAGIFLHAIQSSEFANTVTMLQSHVNSYQEPYDDDYLPPHLCIHSLATSIHQNNQVRMRDVFSP